MKEGRPVAGHLYSASVNAGSSACTSVVVEALEAYKCVRMHELDCEEATAAGDTMNNTILVQPY